MNLISFVVVTILLILSTQKVIVESICQIPVNTKAPKTPLILKYTRNEFLYPHNGVIRIPKSTRIRLSCGEKLFRKFTKSDLVAICEKNDLVKVDDHVMKFKDLECNKGFPTSIVTNKTTTCHKNNVLYKVEFKNDNLSIKTMSLCFDPIEEKVLYSWYFSPRIHKGHQSSVPRPFFVQDEMYSFDVNSAYFRNNQRNTIAKILRSQELASQYIKNDSTHFLSRGHLTCKADYVYGAEQASTFHYANAAPQWQIFNGGNWMKLELYVRDLLTNNTHRYRVITGTYDIATLPDVNNRQQKLYLYVNESVKKLPVPKFYWKVVYDKHDKTGVSIIGINNPYLKKVKSSYKLCKKSICNQIKWLDLQYNNIELGYSYCCTMDQFVKATGYDHIYKILGIGTAELHSQD